MAGDQRLRSSIYAVGTVLLAGGYATQSRDWLNLFTIPVSWWTALAWSAPQLALWALLIPLIFQASVRLPISAPRATVRFLLHLCASGLLAIAVLMVIQLSDWALHWTTLMG